ncbi:hypothetical protein [Bacillus sp. T3]|uniref:hypothetical protein n=1 Tax=Bacillus sp. T3 TaxID=467262 RepID=UPI00298197B8|nr:hypothetical protein [Bacillus sp. T3]
MKFEDSRELNPKVENMIESLIIMIGRSNRRLDDISNRIRQLEQSLIEAAPAAFPLQEESYSFIAREQNPARKA